MGRQSIPTAKKELTSVLSLDYIVEDIGVIWNHKVVRGQVRDAAE